MVIDDSVRNSKIIEALGPGATVTIEGTISNTAKALILASGNGAQVQLDGATVSGGTLAAAAGGSAIVSGGTLAAGAIFETMSGGTAIVSGTVFNSGSLLASGANSLLEIVGGAVVSGGAAVVGNGVVDVLSGGSADVAFLSTGSGGLEIADTSPNSSTFAGRVSGFGGVNHTNHKQFIDLVAVTSVANTISFSYAPAAGSGMLTVSSGGQVVASIDMIGSYTSANFSVTSGVSGTVAIVDRRRQWRQCRDRPGRDVPRTASTCRTSPSARRRCSPMRRTAPTPATRSRCATAAMPRASRCWQLHRRKFRHGCRWPWRHPGH